MKTVLYVTSSFWTEQQQLVFDEAIRLYEQEKEEVILVFCDNSMDSCFFNLKKDRRICTRCQMWNSFFSKKLPSGIKKYKISCLCSPELQEKIKEIKFEYSTIEDIHKLKYGNAYIGFAALSAYITATRCNNPRIDGNFKSFFDGLLRTAIRLYLIFDLFLEKENPDRVVLFNGRMYEVRPLFDLALSKDIEVQCLDWKRSLGDKLYKERFINVLPHNIKNREKIMRDYWEHSSLSETEKIRVATSFYERKQNSLKVGSFVFTDNQERGLLPDNWNNERENIVIFNSSEDEYAAIGKEWNDLNLFSSQIQGIKVILEHFENDTTKHFYLRVHPNLKEIKYKYHTDLYKLNYPNLTVIAADSKISTYTLMKNANKVIVFGSSTGIEAAYCDKPVIQLSGSLYYYFDVTYTPKTESEAFALIDTKNLPSKKGEGVLIFGYYIMNDDKEPMYKLPLGFKKYKFLKWRFNLGLQQKILGSSLLFLLVDIFFNLVLRMIQKDTRIIIPIDEN